MLNGHPFKYTMPKKYVHEQRHRTFFVENWHQPKINSKKQEERQRT